MEDSGNFIALKHVFVDYRPPRSLLKTLSGRGRTSHSVLRDVSFSLPQGQWTTVFGRPGSGKTTLLRVLAGVIKPQRGSVLVNKTLPDQHRLSPGYVSSEESEPLIDSVSQSLHKFGLSHNISDLPARIGHAVEVLEIGHLMSHIASQLSASEKLRVNIARAAISDAPAILMDDVADHLGASQLKLILEHLFSGRSVLISTRFTATAEQLDLPILLLHQGSLAYFGTRDQIAADVGCPRLLDVWVESLRYDLLRNLRAHPGVSEVLLLTADQFAGQRLRITIRSGRYLPAVYDLISQVALIKIDELPASLEEIISRL